MYEHMYVHVYVCMFVGLYVCVYVCTSLACCRLQVVHGVLHAPAVVPDADHRGADPCAVLHYLHHSQSQCRSGQAAPMPAALHSLLPMHGLTCSLLTAALHSLLSPLHSLYKPFTAAAVWTCAGKLSIRWASGGTSPLRQSLTSSTRSQHLASPTTMTGGTAGSVGMRSTLRGVSR